MEKFLGEGCRLRARIRYRRGDVSTDVSLLRVRARGAETHDHRTASPVCLKENIMSDDNKVHADLRTSFGKGFARRLRAEGKIPAVIYGHGTEPVHVALPGHQVSLIIRRANALLDLDIEGKSQLALVKDVQKDPVRQIIEHIDLLVVKKGEKVSIDLPVVLVGESFAGTIANLDATTLAVEAEATHIPEQFEIDVTDAEAGTQFLASQIALPSGTTLLTDAETLVVNVTAAQTAEAAEAELEQAEAEAGIEKDEPEAAAEESAEGGDSE